MRYLIQIFTLIAAFNLISCSKNYHLRQAEKHIDKAKAKGARVDKDTVFVNVPFEVVEVRDSLISHHHYDTVLIKEACEELIQGKPGAFRKVIEEVVKEVNIDSVYNIPVSINDKRHLIKVRVQVKNDIEKFYFDFYVYPFKVNEEISVPCETVKSGMSTWNIVILALFCLILGFGIGIFKK